MTDALAAYVDAIRREYATGKATEHSYRDALKRLLESVENGLTVINEPRRIEVGAPDYIVERRGVPLGFVEAKDLDEDLDKLDKRSKKQLDDYRAALPNLIHTNYLHFRWYVNGDLREDIRLGELRPKRLDFQTERFGDLNRLLTTFINTTTPTVDSPLELARRMAGMTRQIKDLIANSLPDSAALQTQIAAFEHTLIPHLTADEFADMYAQTLAYGLFAARVRYTSPPDPLSTAWRGGDFTLQNAFWNLPDTNPFLRKFFQEIAPDLDERVRWQAETLATLLAHAKMDDILRDFGRRTRQEDPVVHFYETFLREYDPAKREQRGVYYTPEPVVSYIVRSVDHLLKTRFGRPDGLADTQTLLLDPAAGTGTFLYFVIQQIYDELVTRGGQRGLWSSYVRDHLLPRLFGFELLMAPYAVAHMKLGIQLQETGYEFKGGQRLGIYLTNTLEAARRASDTLFAQFIAKEADEAAAIKREKPIMVVLGNPPYSGHSANTGQWISALVRDYYFVDGQPLGERNPKWLQDDYVKFIRFGQWRINQTGSGALAFVTNHGYLDNPTFRGMRQHLLGTFDDIYILNLHGNSKKRETTPDGGKDENVFDIQQGVAIGIFVKDNPTPQSSPYVVERGLDAPAAPPLHAMERGPATGGSPRGRGEVNARVHYADLYGLRPDKYHALLESDLSSTTWQTLTPTAPFYLFVPQNLDLKGEYEQGWKVTEMMSVNVLGFQTHRDFFAIDFDRDKLYQRIKDMRENQLSDDEFRRKYSVTDNRDWQLAQARARLRQNEKWEQDLIECAYRPFDKRAAYFSEVAMDYPRRELVRHVMGKENLCLLTSRQQATVGYRHCWVAYTPANDCVISTTSREANQVFPLYLYPDPEERRLLDAPGDWSPGQGGRTPNLSKKFVDDLAAKIGLTFTPDGHGDLTATFGPEDVFHYTYAVFHSPTYRERYAEFLKIDFPRLPLTSDRDLFRALCQQGAALVDLHLLRGAAVGRFITTFPVDGDGVVASGYPQYEAGAAADPTAKSPPSYTDLQVVEGGLDAPTAPPRHDMERGLATAGSPRGRGEVGRVYINKTQYFDGVPEAVWGFQVGGYQVLDKWLKDRRGRTLSFDDLRHYQRVVVALAETMRLMDTIDDLIPAWPLA
jgi:hypothetical protein